MAAARARYSICHLIFPFQNSFSFSNRVLQLRSYIAKKFSAEEMDDLLAGKLPPCPPNYIPPKALADDMALATSRRRQSEHEQQAGGIQDDDRGTEAAATATFSQLAPRQGRSDWTRLLGLVDGQAAEPDVRYALFPQSRGLHFEGHMSTSGPLPSGIGIGVHVGAFPRPATEGATDLKLPAIPSFTSIASAAPMHNPVKDASELLGKVSSRKTPSQMQRIGSKERRKRGSGGDGKANSNKKSRRPISPVEHSHVMEADSDSLIVFDEENSLAGHSLGFASPHHSAEQHLQNVFRDGGSPMGGEGSLSHLSLDWGNEEEGVDPAEGYWGDEFSLCGAQTTPTKDKNNHTQHRLDSFGATVEVTGSPSILRDGSKTKANSGGRKKANKKAQNKKSKKEAGSSSSLAVAQDMIGRQPKAADSRIIKNDQSQAQAQAVAELSVTEDLNYADGHSLMPVSDEFSMM